MEIKWRESSLSTNELTIKRRKKVLFDLTYAKPQEGSIGPFVEDEDFDFGLFVYNVWNEPYRRNGIYTKR